jgi:hypothetical protein
MKITTQTPLLTLPLTGEEQLLASKPESMR